MVLFLYLGRRPRVLTVRILYTLLASIEHVVLVLNRIAAVRSPILLIVQLLSRLLQVFAALGTSFLPSPIVLLTLHLHLLKKLLPKLIILVLRVHLHLCAHRFHILHKRRLPHHRIIGRITSTCRLPRLHYLSAFPGAAARCAVVLVRVTSEIVQITVWTRARIVASPISRSLLLLVIHNLIDHLPHLLKLEVLLLQNVLELLAVLPQFRTVVVDVLDLHLQLVLQLFPYLALLELVAIRRAHFRLTLDIRHLLGHLLDSLTHLVETFIFLLDVLLQSRDLLLSILVPVGLP